MKKNALAALYEKDGTKKVLSSLISILAGLLVGGIAVLIVGLCNEKISLTGAWDGIRIIFAGIFSTGRDAAGTLTWGFNAVNLGNMLFRATPLIMTGLSVAVAFKTGLFNIGAPGQYLISTMVTLMVALSIPSESVPVGVIWVLAFLAGCLSGALWGAIPGLVKALLNINEVLACIMTNWIAANLVTWMFDISSFKNLTESTKSGYIYKTTFNGVATPKLGLDMLFPGSQVNGGILVAIVIAIAMYILMNKTTLGYELKACGANRQYPGQAQHRAVHGHRRCAGRRRRCAVLAVRQHGVLLVHLSVPARRGLQRHPRGPAGGVQPHRGDLYRLLHVHAGHLRPPADQLDGVQRVHHRRHHRHHRVSVRLLPGHPHDAVPEEKAPRPCGGDCRPGGGRRTGGGTGGGTHGTGRADSGSDGGRRRPGMTFLIQQTLIYAVPLMIVALAGVFAERSGIINLALEGIMIFGAFIGVLFVRLMQGSEAVLAAKQAGDWVALQGLELLTMLVAAAMGAVFSLLLSFASINLRADQTIGGTALNLMAPALVLFLIRIIANQNTLQMATGDSASWFMLKKSTFGVDKSVDWGFFGETFLNKIYLATYICILLFIILSVILYKTKFGLRLRACGENPQAADSLGINVYRMRYAGVTISGALAGMGGFVYAMTTANCSSNGDVAGFGFLALAVMIFGNWKPLNIAGASLLFGLFKCIAAAYASIDINGDGVFLLADIGISAHLYRMLPYLITLLVLAFTSKKSRAPKAEGIPYDKGQR